MDFDKVVARKDTGCSKWDAGYDLSIDMLPMCVADMDLPCSPQILSAVKKRVDHGIFGYGVYTDDYFDAIRIWQKKRFGVDTAREWIHPIKSVLTGVAAAVSAFTNPGEPVVLQTPVYGAFKSVIENNDRKVLENPLVLEDGMYRMGFEDLRKKLAQSCAKLLVFCSPHNPVGRVWEEWEIEKLIAVCREFGTVIVSDEIHSDLVFEGSHHPSIQVEGAEETVISVYAPTKTFNLASLANGYYVVKSERLGTAMAKVMASLFVDTQNVLSSAATIAAYTQSDEWYQEMLSYIRQNQIYFSKELNSRFETVETAVPQGTYLMWLDFEKSGYTQQEVFDRCLNIANIKPTPGQFFVGGYGSRMRFNVACPRTYCDEALVRLKKAFQ